MNKQELLSLAGQCGSKAQLTRKLEAATKTPTREATIALLNSLLAEHNITRKELVAAFNPTMRARHLAKKNKGTS